MMPNTVNRHVLTDTKLSIKRSMRKGKSLVVIARFPFVDWAELLEACHLMSKPNSSQEKLVRSMRVRIIVRF